MKGFFNDKKKVYGIVIVAIILILVMMIAVNVVFKLKLSQIETSSSEEREYKYHVAMISSEPSEVFWTSIYEGARDMGVEKNCYVENFGVDLSGNYSTGELLEMAIAANVQGIIVQADHSGEVTAQIDKATSQGIPVITILRDASDSKRRSFVSSNDFALGEMYGSQVLDAIGNAKSTKIANNGDGVYSTASSAKVTVLISSDDKDASPNLIYSGISEAVSKASAEVELWNVMIDSSGGFESEEIIRNLLLDPEKRPDVIVCLSAVDTVSAYQCVTDYNLVGKVQIIGYYAVPRILEGIQKGIIKSSVAVNAEEMGKVSVQGMYDYLTEAYVSEYLPVQAELVTQDNVERYIEEGDE